jgi:hypothetical protein
MIICQGVMMKVFCHGFNCNETGLISYKGLNTIEDVDEVVIYNEKGKVVHLLDKENWEAVAIFSQTIFVVKKGEQYFWSDVLVNVTSAETVENLENGKNYAKVKGEWLRLPDYE